MTDFVSKEVLQFGAGNIGRGFVGVMLSRAGYSIVFVDVVEPLLDQLNGTGQYSVIEVDATGEQPVTISRFQAMNAKDEANVIAKIGEVDLLTTAVGPNILSVIAPVIARGLQYRAKHRPDTPLNIIACENLIDNSWILRDYVMSHIPSDYRHYVANQVGFPRCVVDKVVNAPVNLDRRDPLTVVAERQGQLIVDRLGFVGEPPEIAGMQLTDDLTTNVEQKIFTVNSGHAVAAYLGYRHGYEYIHEAVQDPEIRQIVSGAMRESGEVLIQRHDLTAADQQKYADRALDRFDSVSLPDPISRVAREPKRKLAPNDRMIRPATLALEAGIVPHHLATGIAAALLYDSPDDNQAVELAGELKREGLSATLQDVCGLSPDTMLARLIKEKVSDFLP